MYYLTIKSRGYQAEFVNQSCFCSRYLIFSEGLKFDPPPNRNLYSNPLSILTATMAIKIYKIKLTNYQSIRCK